MAPQQARQAKERNQKETGKVFTSPIFTTFQRYDFQEGNFAHHISYLPSISWVNNSQKRRPPPVHPGKEDAAETAHEADGIWMVILDDLFRVWEGVLGISIWMLCLVFGMVNLLFGMLYLRTCRESSLGRRFQQSSRSNPQQLDCAPHQLDSH